MMRRLQPLKISAQTAMERPRQIKAGHVSLSGGRAPVITALSDDQKAIYLQLEISFPNIKQLQDL